MSLKFRSLLVLTVGTVLGFSLSLSRGVLAEREVDDELPWEQAALLAEVLERVKRDYVDSVSDEELIEAAIRGMVADLDAHSAFLNSEEYREIRISTTGTYSGVGLEVSLQDGVVLVVAPIEGTPADKAGIRPGDVIISIDDIPVDDSNLGDTIKRMRGETGTLVTLSVIRNGQEEPLRYTMVRANVQVPSVRHSMIEPDYGYVRITHFSETTSRDMVRAIKSMEAESTEGLRGLVLDLRNNPGGVLDAAVDVSDAFLDEGVIVTADGRAEESQFSMQARKGDVLDGVELVVLVNAGSASASEIVAGALQDHDRAKIMGTSTFGKGSVQTVMPLSNGRAIKLTTSRYFTPSGDSIHEMGITPDVWVDQPELDRFVADAEADSSESSPADDHQLQEALRALKEPKLVRSEVQ